MLGPWNSVMWSLTNPHPTHTHPDNLLIIYLHIGITDAGFLAHQAFAFYD